MLKLVAVGLWIIMVTAGATLASVYLGKQGADSANSANDLGIEQFTSELTSIPIIRGGEVVGYVLLQLAFGADRSALNEEKFDPMPYMRDAAFRVVFTSNNVDFRHLKPGDLDQLTDAISKEANRRLGREVVRQVLFQQLNFVRREDIRTNWIGSGGGGD